MTSKWEELAADKRNRINESIPEEWRIKELPAGDCFFDFPAKSGLLSDQEISITETSATDLVQQLAHGTLKAVDVTMAFCKRAALAHQLVRTTCLRMSWISLISNSSLGELLPGILPRNGNRPSQRA
jgi:amidase